MTWTTRSPGSSPTPQVHGRRAHAHRLAQRRAIIARVVADGRAACDPFAGLTRIGIDELSYKRGHRYLVAVVCHTTGRLVWAGVGREEKTLHGFFDLLGEERCQMIKIVTADGASWIANVVAERAKQATLCTDSFHVCKWASDALVLL